MSQTPTSSAIFCFALVGLALLRTGFPVVCLVIGFLLSDLFETSLRQSLLLYRSDFSVILTSPIAILFLLMTAFILLRAMIRR